MKTVIRYNGHRSLGMNAEPPTNTNARGTERWLYV